MRKRDSDRNRKEEMSGKGETKRVMDIERKRGVKVESIKKTRRNKDRNSILP